MSLDSHRLRSRAGRLQLTHHKPLMIDDSKDLFIVLIRGNHEPFNRLALNESIHNLRDVGDRDASVKEVIGFD